MIVPCPIERAAALGPTKRDAILTGFFSLGQNTCEIGRAVVVPETVVAEVVRAERERRVEIYAGRRER